MQPAKMTGFCDIVSQAALKKGKTVSAKSAKMTTTTTKTSAAAAVASASAAKATVKAIETAKTKTTTTTSTSVTTTKSKSVDKWEEFREKRLAEMERHKINVERRMQTSRNIDGQMYWSQRADKLKRYPKHEALHPSWYTENIYSNNSIDLETDDYFCADDQYGPNDYDRELFQRKRSHIDTGYGYPKSRSCCFGSGYDERPKPVLMPKSSSFTATGSSGRGMSNIRTTYSTVEEENFVEVRRQNNCHRNNVNNRSGLRKFYCWENDRQHNIDKDDLYTTHSPPHLDDDCYMKNSEIYQIERDRNYYKKPSIDIQNVHATTNANYIRNIWHNRSRSASLYKVQNVNEINGNYLDEYNGMGYEKRHHDIIDNAQPFEEEYLIIHQNKPNINIFSARNGFDDPGSVSRRQSYHSNDIYSSDLDPYADKYNYMNHEKNINCLDMTMGYSINAEPNHRRHHHHHHHRTKSMLEVKPPNRYDDDSSSDSTIDDLYDFNFDFANQFDLDYRNNNSTTAKNLLAKEKNINVDNYSKYRKSNIDTIDDTDNELNDVDFDDNNSQSDEDEDINFNTLASPRHERSRYQRTADNEYHLMTNRSAHDRFYDNCMSPAEFYPPNAVGGGGVGSDTNNQNHIGPNETSAMNKGHPQINNMDLDDHKIYNNNNNIDPRNDGNRNIDGPAISLINNIFSIYKPRKYSPVRCRTAGGQKVAGITKCMNVPSTVRPLGAPYNDFLTSMKRPLTITPSCFTTQKRNWSIPTSTGEDQAHFKIIPEKTGLKISPLYRFGYEDDSKLRLKCTARPLLFPL